MLVEKEEIASSRAEPSDLQSEPLLLTGLLLQVLGAYNGGSFIKRRSRIGLVIGWTFAESNCYSKITFVNLACTRYTICPLFGAPD